MPGTYFACDMAALTAEQRAAHVRNLQRLFGAVERVTEITEGYSFSVPATPALFGQAAEFLVLERLCCPFFDFGVEWPAGATSFRLVITGAEGIKPFIQAEFGSALPPGVGF